MGGGGGWRVDVGGRGWMWVGGGWYIVAAGAFLIHILCGHKYNLMLKHYNDLLDGGIVCICGQLTF